MVKIAILAPLLLFLPRDTFGVRVADEIEVEGEVDGEVDAADMSDAFNQLTGEQQKVVELLEANDKLASEMSCEDWQARMHKLLVQIDTNMTDMFNLSAPCVDHDCLLYANAIAALKKQANDVMTITELSSRKGCLKSLYSESKVAAALAKVLDAVDTLGDGNAELKESYGDMVKWQHSLLSLGPRPDFDLSTSFDVKDHCPDECRWCSFRHKSIFKKKETLAFKCGLRRKRAAPKVDKAGNGLVCTAPKRRLTAFWQRKTWCRVSDTDLVLQRRGAAQVSCSLLFIEPLTDKENATDFIRTCHKMEQGVVLSGREKSQYNDLYLTRPNDSGMNLHDGGHWHAMNFLIQLGVSVGLSAVVEGSEGGKLLDVFAKDFPTEGRMEWFDMSEAPTGLVTCGDALTRPTWVGSAVGAVLRFTVAGLIAAGILPLTMLMAPVIWAWSIMFFFGFNGGLTELVMIPFLPLIIPWMAASALGRKLDFSLAPHDCASAQVIELGGICVNAMYKENKAVHTRPDSGEEITISCDYDDQLRWSSSS